MSGIVDLIVPPSGHAGGSGYVPPGSQVGSVELSSTSFSATANNVALLFNSFSPAASEAFVDRVGTGSSQVHVPRLDSQDIQRALLTGVGAVGAAKTLLVAAGASLAAPGVGWALGAVFLVGAGAYTIVHMARARKIAQGLNSGYVLYIDQGDYSLIEDALLNGIESYRSASNPWVPVGLHASDGVLIRGGPCYNKSHKGLSFHFYPPHIHQGQHLVDCYDSHGIRMPKPWAGYGAVATTVRGVAPTDLVRVGAHACLLSVWGKGIPVSYIDTFARYIVRSWQAREFVSRRMGDLLKASRSSPVPLGYLSYADICASPQGHTAVSNTGWSDLWVAASAASHAAGHQFGVLNIDRYWVDGNPVNTALLQTLYFIYSYALYVGVPWDVVYQYLTGSIDSIPMFSLSVPSRPSRPPRPSLSSPPPPPPSSSSADSSPASSSAGSSRQFPWVAVLPTVALGLVLLRRKRR